MTIVLAALELILVAVLTLGGFYLGDKYGARRNEATHSAADAAAVDVEKRAEQGAAAAIAKLRPVNSTVIREIERETISNPVYRDCVVPADGVRLINQAIAGSTGAVSPGDSQLPAADPVAGQN